MTKPPVNRSESPLNRSDSTHPTIKAPGQASQTTIEAGLTNCAKPGSTFLAWLTRSSVIMAAAYLATLIFHITFPQSASGLQPRLLSYSVLVSVIMLSGIYFCKVTKSATSQALLAASSWAVAAWVTGILSQRFEAGFPLLPLLLNISILAYSSILAAVAAEKIRNRSDLLLVLILVSLVDVISVFAGPAKTVISSDLAKYFIFNFPLPATGGAGYELHLVFENAPGWFLCDGLLGFGDAFFGILLVLVAAKEGLGSQKAALLVCAGLLSAGVVSALAGIIPALPFVSLAFIAGFGKKAMGRFGVREARLLAFGVTATIAVSALIVIFR